MMAIFDDMLDKLLILSHDFIAEVTSIPAPVHNHPEVKFEYDFDLVQLFGIVLLESNTKFTTR